MEMTNLKFLYILIIFVIGSMLLTCVSASDLNNTDIQVNGSENNNIELDTPGSFSELQDDINNLSSGDIYNVEKDYYYHDGEKIDYIGISIYKDNITINGNNHIIDGKNKLVLFSVFGKNVKIFNLTLINGNYSDKSIYKIGTFSYKSCRSPILWLGNDGILSNCVFMGNSALNIGGAISWKGNNGEIKNSLFINNTARIIGGAIYIAGSNNKISNCMFLNSTSKIGGDAIYVDRNHKNLSISIFGEEDSIMYGNVANINVDYLDYIYETYFGGEKINLIPVVYSTLVSKEPCVSLFDGFTCYGEYINKEFFLTLTKNFSNGLVYQSRYNVHDVGDISNVFLNLVQEKYQIDIYLTKKITVNNLDDYEYARTVKGDSMFSTVKDIIAYATDVYMNEKFKNSVTKQLEVDFAPGLIINSKKTWKIDDKCFDIVNIRGHGATIKTESGNRDEHIWVKIKNFAIFSASDLTIQGFNNAVENFGGLCIFNNVHFDGNHLDYWIERDWGAAILNGGQCICNNCTFTDNNAQKGGAIFTQGSLTLNNCSFSGNKAKDEGNDVLNADKGEVYINGEKIKGSSGCVEYVKSMESGFKFLFGFGGLVFSVFLGTIAGLATLNPLVGIAAGAGLGLFVGSMCAAIIVTNTYDINVDRLKTCLVIMSGCSLAGAFGGALGTSIAISTQAAAASEGAVVETVANAVPETIGERELFNAMWQALHYPC